MPEAKTLTVTTSWDDGHPLDLRVADLLDKYAVKGTFYVAPRNIEFPASGRIDPVQLADLAGRHEIGAHTMTHRRLPQLDDATAHREIADSKSYLEDQLSTAVPSFCYPGGQYHRRHLKMVLAAGFRTARTVRRHHVGDVANRLQIPTTMHCYRHLSDAPWLMGWTRGRLLRGARYYLAWDELAIALFERSLAAGGVYHLWGHSWELDRFGDWHRLERVLAHLARRTAEVNAGPESEGRIRHRTNDEAYPEAGWSGPSPQAGWSGHSPQAGWSGNSPQAGWSGNSPEAGW
ncbi:MAG: polysaccharide deacetylase family protein [Actinomycetales bacterium]